MHGARPEANTSLGPCPSMRCVTSVRRRVSIMRTGPGRTVRPGLHTRLDSGLASLDLVRANLLVKVRSLDAEPDGRSRDVPVGHPERVDDVLPLGLLAELAERQVLAPGARAEVAGRVDGSLVVAAVDGRGLCGGRLGLFLEGAGVGVFREVGDGDVIAAQDRASLDPVLELAHVAGPLSRDERLDGVVVARLRADAVLAGELLHEGEREERNVLDALA